MTSDDRPKLGTVAHVIKAWEVYRDARLAVCRDLPPEQVSRRASQMAELGYAASQLAASVDAAMSPDGELDRLRHAAIVYDGALQKDALMDDDPGHHSVRAAMHLAAMSRKAWVRGEK